MDRVRWIEFKSKKILMIDFANLNTSKPDQKDIAMEVLRSAKKEVDLSKEKILFLTDITDATANRETMQAMKDLVDYIHEKKMAQKECMVGVDGIRKSLLNSVNLLSKTKIIPCSTLDEAKNYLVE